MKLLIFITSILLVFASVQGQDRTGSSFRTQSYYGFSGLMFIPSTQITKPGQAGIGYSSRPSIGSELSLIPYSVRINYGLGQKSIELGVTNTPLYSSERIYSGVSLNHGVSDFNMALPLFPSIKYLLMPMARDNYQVAMSLGFALPYGVYYVVDKHVNVNFFDLTVHTGVATKLTTYHVFAGITTTFGNRIGQIQRDFNLEMLLEAAWGGSLKQLDKKEESFISMAFRYAWTNSLYIKTFLRYDNQPLIENGEEVDPGPVTLVGLGLDYQWNFR
jgi:hypothetical protein